MKIYVVSKKYLKQIWFKDKTFFYNEKRYFISIAGAADGCEYPNPFLVKDSKRVLHLLFDDITESEKDNPAVIIFDNEHADKIFQFIKTIPNDVELYVNGEMIEKDQSKWCIDKYNMSGSFDKNGKLVVIYVENTGRYFKKWCCWLCFK